MTFEFHEHDAVAELGMAGDDDSTDDDRAVVDPEGSPNAYTEWELDQHFDVAAAATEVGGHETQGNVAAFLVDFDLDLYRVARMQAAIGFARAEVKGWASGEFMDRLRAR